MAEAKTEPLSKERFLRMSRPVLLALALLVAAGCRHTRLTVALKVDGVLGKDLDRLFELAGAPESLPDRPDGKVVIDFRKEDPDMPAQERLTRALDIIQRSAPPEKGPLFAWRVAALDPELVKSLGLDAPPARDFPLDLDLRSGEPALKVLKTGFDVMQGGGGEQLCVYAIPLGSGIPDAAFTNGIVAEKVKAKLPPAVRKRVSGLLDSLGAPDAEEAKDHVVATNPELAPLTKNMLLEKRKTLNITFGEGTKRLVDLPVNFASGGEFADCHDKILAGGDAFFRDILFPELSGKVAGYKLEQVLF
jgi:hypothetical protein